MTGESIPYCISNDNYILLLFILSLIGCTYVSAFNANNIVEKIKNMFYYTGENIPYNTRANIGPVGNTILYTQFILYSAIIGMWYMTQSGKLRDAGEPYIVFTILFLLFLLYLPIKGIIYAIVNRILFSPQQAKEWHDSYFFTIQLTGIILLPLATMLIILPSVCSIVFYCYLTFVAIIYIIMLFIRCHNIIFKENCYYIDIFLYLCAIEFAPIGLVWRIINETNLFKLIKF